jgi:hypothetical protein
MPDTIYFVPVKTLDFTGFLTIVTFGGDKPGDKICISIACDGYLKGKRH